MAVAVRPQSLADTLLKRLGCRLPVGPAFHTAANRECGLCRVIKPGAEFDVPVTPGRPDLNLCRGCA
jgi:hypothetical protein